LGTEDGPWSDNIVTNRYDNRLRVGLDLKQPTGVWTNKFTYDATRRLTNVTSKAGSFGYVLASGAPSTLTVRLDLPNTSYITNIYDANARLLSTTLKHSTNSILNSHSYSYNLANQRTQQLFNAGSTYGYTYDKIGQLKVADSATASEDRGYAYDTAWNLNYRTNSTTLNTFNVNVLNELTNSTPGGNCIYDGNGNLTSSHGEKRTYVYDDENRLEQLYVANAFGGPDKATEFVYDGLGRLRIRREYSYVPSFLEGDWQLDSETRYIYDLRRVIQERDSSNVPTVSYTRGTDLSGSLEGAGGIGGLLGRSHGYSSGNWSTHNFYHADGNGNITYLVNSSQSSAATYRYDPYGNLISSSGTLASANVYRFSSKEVHTGTGLYYYGFRFYEPNLQRWLNRDPIGEWGGLNLYGYVGNNPVNFYDPYGLAIGDWWDARTWFNSGFTESWSDSANSIGEALGNALAGNWGGVEDAYDSGVLGQTKDADPFTKYGTRACLAVGSAAAIAAGGLIAADAAGISSIGRANMGWKGGEITFTRPGAPTPDWRINPFGGSGYPPHYHRRPGIGKHRPWDGGF